MESNQSLAAPVSASDWAKLRPVIQSLYLEKDMALKDVMHVMFKEYGFKAR